MSESRSEVVIYSLLGKDYEGREYSICDESDRIAVYYENIKYLQENTDRGERVKERTEFLIVQAAEYIFQQLPQFEEISRNWIVEFTETGSVRGEGMLMRVPIDLVEGKFMNIAEDSYEEALAISIFVHELMHGLTPTSEALPMLAEMMYMLDSGGEMRIDQISSFLENDQLEEPHVKGLGEISGWFGYDSTRHFLKEFPNLDRDKIGGVFTSKAMECARED